MKDLLYIAHTPSWMFSLDCAFRVMLIRSYLLGASLELLARRTRSWLRPEPPGGSSDLGDRITVLLTWMVSSPCSSPPKSKVESGWMETGVACVSGVYGSGYTPSWPSTSCSPGGQWDGTAPWHPEPGFTGEIASFLLIGILGTVSDSCSSPGVGSERETGKRKKKKKALIQLIS